MNTPLVLNPKGVEIFNDAVQALLLSQPFFGTLLMKLKHKADPTCPTLCVDGRHVIYGPDFMAQQNVDQATFCVAHEVMHMAWEHLPRIRHYVECGIGPDGKPLDPELFNMALDYPINAALLSSGQNIGAYPAGIEICLDPKYPADMTPEEVYCDLRKQQKKNGGKGPGKGKPLDEHAAGDGPAEGKADAITGADVIQAANVCKAMRGTLPAGIDRLIGEIKKPSSSPWSRLRQAVTTALSGYDRTSWRRLNRRLIVRGIGYPGKVAEGAGIVGVVADTSGSIGDAMLSLFGGHMAAIIADARPREVRVYWTDAEVHRVDVVKTSTELRMLLSKNIPGGGGTDMCKGMRAAEEDKCDVVVCLTDGYTPFCAIKPPAYWAITSSGVSSPYGTTLHIGEA